MLYVVNSRHYTEWEQGKDEEGNPEWTVWTTKQELQYLMVGVYSSLSAASRAIAEFSRDFEPDEDEMEGPLEGFNVSVAKLDEKIGDGFHLASVDVIDDDLKVYELLDKANIEYLERLRKVEAAAGT
jgi:hypothetical protein